MSDNTDKPNYLIPEEFQADIKDDIQTGDQLFAMEMLDVKQTTTDRIGRNRPKTIRKSKDKAYHRDQAQQDVSNNADGLSTESVNIVESDQILNFASAGIQIKTINKLRKGHLQWEQGIDLHGFTIEQARTELSDFIRASYYQNKHVVLVVHGKAYSQSGALPLIKSYVNDWLRQIPEVLAFSSAQPKDGGTGALYVLLKRKTKESFN